MSKITALLDDWKAEAPDRPRDKMLKGQVWLLRDWIPEKLGSSLESRNAWVYWGTGVADAYYTAQIWVNTPLGPHHLRAYPYHALQRGQPVRLLDPSVGGATGALNPMAQQFGAVCIPRVNALPIFLRYLPGATTPTILTTPATIPQGRVALAWSEYFVLANTQANPNRIHWVPWEDFTDTSPVNPIPTWVADQWWDTDGEVTALARTANSMIIFHPNSIEKFRGSIPPGGDRGPGDLWRESVYQGVGCSEPHSVAYWNENVIWADARGVFLTDGSNTRDLTAQGGISREWRRTYQPGWRLAGGVYGDSYLVTMVDQAAQQFKKAYVCDLYARSFVSFSNIPCTSFVTTTGQQERFYGGTYDKRLIDLTKMWDEADSTVDTVDGNGTAVLPQLETGWYKMTKEETMKRVKNVLTQIGLAETIGYLRVYASERINPEPSDWFLLREMRSNDLVDNRGVPIVQPVNGVTRRVLPLGHEAYGFAFKIETTGKIKNLKVYAFSVEGPGLREQSYAA